MGKSTRSHTSVDVPCQATRPAIQSALDVQFTGDNGCTCAVAESPVDRRNPDFEKGNRQMVRQTVINAAWLAAVIFVVWANPIRVEAQVLNELIGGAKKEPEIAFTAGPSTFGGRQAFSELQAAFNKKFGLNARINFTAGPSMPAMAARIITEAKEGRRSSTDVHLGPPATQAELTTKGYWSESTIRACFPG